VNKLLIATLASVSIGAAMFFGSANAQSAGNCKALAAKNVNWTGCFRPNPSQYFPMDLSGMNFTNADVQGFNFASRNLTGANFTNANLRGVNFSNANLTKANFTGADLGTTGAAAGYTSLQYANLTGAIFTSTTKAENAYITPKGTRGRNGQLCTGSTIDTCP